jgi:hypothetical protein
VIVKWGAFREKLVGERRGKEESDGVGIIKVLCIYIYV